VGDAADKEGRDDGHRLAHQTDVEFDDAASSIVLAEVTMFWSVWENAKQGIRMVGGNFD